MKVEWSPGTNQDYIREHWQTWILSPIIGAELATPPIQYRWVKCFCPIPGDEEGVQHLIVCLITGKIVFSYWGGHSHLHNTVADHRQQMTLLDMNDIFSRSRPTGQPWTVIGNSVCLFFVCVCLSSALAQLTDNMDPMYIIPKLSSESEMNAHVNNNKIQPSWIFWKMAKDWFVSCFSASRSPRRLICCESDLGNILSTFDPL